MLRNIRITFAVLLFCGFLVLFLDLSGTLPPYLAFLGKLQLVPAFLSGSVGMVLALAALTLLFGRIYCSTLCPLGVMQDVISHCRGKRRFHYRPGKTALRVTVVLVFMASLWAGIPVIFGLLDPYSAFGRVATDIMLPAMGGANNILALVAEKMDSVAIAPGPVLQKGISALIGAVATLGVVSWLAWRGGRTWCNTLCPVGTVLGVLGRVALVRPRILAEKCVQCGRCAAVCKASCIYVAPAGARGGPAQAEVTVDASRCVACFNCQTQCRHGALSVLPLMGGSNQATQQITAPERQVQSIAAHSEQRSTPLVPGAKHALSRRAVLAGVLTGAAFIPAHAASRVKDAVIPALTRKERPIRTQSITPPGSNGFRHFTARCTGCQLCVSACPNHVLHAVDTGTGMLQPTLTFEHGFCRVNCVACAAVCPTGAIRPISIAEKSAIQIGRAAVKPELCIVNTDNVVCTACKKSCAPGAITLIGDGEKKTPAVDKERCTGCGACEYICPARPFAAIRVEGNVEHRRI